MSTTPSPDRRFIVALTAAVASVTLAIGATTAALLGWVGPSAEPSAPTPPAAAGSGSAQLVDVPITPAAPPPRPSIEPSTASELRLSLAEATRIPKPARIPMIATIGLVPLALAALLLAGRVRTALVH